MKKEIKHNWFYEAEAETVWAFLTQPELVAVWLMENDIKPVVGHHFMFKTKPLPAMDFDGNVYCEILEATPFKKLVYSWKGGPGNGQLTLDSVVTWTLVSKNGGTELFLVHSGFSSEGNQYGFDTMDMGWKKMLEGKIVALIAQYQVDEKSGS